MTLNELVLKVRRYTRDTTGSLFEDADVIDFCNEGIHRIRKIKELDGMKTLATTNDSVIILPEKYQYLISLYGASRCFTQDEQNTMAQLFMNEFETKLDELEKAIKSGELILKDENGNDIVSTDVSDYVVNVYFKNVFGGEGE